MGENANDIRHADRVLRSSAALLPELPSPFVYHPQAQKKICDGVGGHRIAEAPFANDKPLISDAAENSGKPLAMDESKEKRADGECNEMELLEGNLVEFFLDDVAIKEGTKEGFLDGWNDEGAAKDACGNEEPGHVGKY